MGEPDTGESLLVWALATVHAALLVVVAVGLLYAVGGLGARLAALGTSVGVVAYLYLWAVAWWTNRRWLDAVDGALPTGDANPVDVLVGALRWGAVAGVVIVAPVVAAVTVLVGGAGGIDALPFLFLGAAVSGLLAAGVGALVGGVLALLDLSVLRASRAWLPASAVDRDGMAADVGTDTP